MSVCAQWRTGRQGTLAPVEQAKLWALREVLHMLGEDDDQYQWMSGLVQVVGGGNPGRNAVRMFFAKVDADPEWHPGTSRRCVLRTSTGSSRIASWFLSPVPSWWTRMNKMMCDLFKWRPEKKNVAVPPDPLLKF